MLFAHVLGSDDKTLGLLVFNNLGIVVDSKHGLLFEEESMECKRRKDDSAIFDH